MANLRPIPVGRIEDIVFTRNFTLLPKGLAGLEGSLRDFECEGPICEPPDRR